MASGPTPFLKKLHAKSMANRESIGISAWCGCFYCVRLLRPAQVSSWTDKGRTALCPFCGVDAVLAEGDLNRPISIELLESMNATFFVEEAFGKPTAPACQLLGIGPAGAVPPVGEEVACMPWADPAKKKKSGAPAESMESLRRLTLTSSDVFQHILDRFPWKSLAVAMGAGGAFWGPADSYAWALGGSATPEIASWCQAALGLLVVGMSGWFLAKSSQLINLARSIKKGEGNLKDSRLFPGLTGNEDLGYPKTGDALLLEARDWAMACQGTGVAEVWKQWEGRFQDVRNHDLRRFVLAAQAHVGSQPPYVPGEPI